MSKYNTTEKDNPISVASYNTQQPIQKHHS